MRPRIRRLSSRLIYLRWWKTTGQRSYRQATEIACCLPLFVKRQTVQVGTVTFVVISGRKRERIFGIVSDDWWLMSDGIPLQVATTKRNKIKFKLQITINTIDYVALGAFVRHRSCYCRHRVRHINYLTVSVVAKRKCRKKNWDRGWEWITNFIECAINVHERAKQFA